MLHVFIGEILANMTQVSDVAPGPLVFLFFSSTQNMVTHYIHIYSIVSFYTLVKDWTYYGMASSICLYLIGRPN
jgi:hypothetical protein